ncbi:MAG: serine/threonine protein kinase [Acidobacteria bacterium]|nr:serine/threonine protein kinase [Acidobacteriota bacterium]
MDRERWRRIDTIFKSALELRPEERAAFLERACAGDAALRREVESLIAHDRDESALPTKPLVVYAAADAAAEQLLAERRKPDEARPPLSSDSIDEARFVPGDILAGRYRVVGLVGRGGMGEVYRADDLVLKQAVALKFLPKSVSGDGAALERFRREVRVARQISHPNVSRVYDIGEADGLHFLSMEFIRGEELASVLKRFGRLPADKAAEIGRQICAGLAAAHKGGVLHRDLKPANVMIDETGDARVTDFGLAALAEETRGEEMMGTPAYMSPEQLAGRELTLRSDIYSLGLVLYELFTGRRAFGARTLPELLRLRRSDAQPSSPSSHVKDLDPLVERVILRCLDTDPARRPASALEVAAALPGGDPLAAALALGETPSPEMVAAAPKEGALRPAVAVALLASFLGGLALVCLLTRGVALYRTTPLEKSPEVMRVRSREIIKRLGYAEPPADHASGMTIDRAYLDSVAANDQSPARWERLRTGEPSVYYFWYRQSPRHLFLPTSYPIIFDEPAWDVTGMAGVVLDSEGRLRKFVAVPPQSETPREPAPGPAAAPDWSALFAEAGFDQSKFQPAAGPTWVPPHASDARAAWGGAYPSRPDIRVHVEAASYRGRPVYFEVVNPWDQPVRDVGRAEAPGERALGLAVIALFIMALVGGALLALRNLRLGRGDRRGAFRLALFMFAARMLVEWVFGAHHFGSPGEEFILLVEYLKSGLFVGAFVWLLYLALEPLVRRRWPERIISWSRLMAGGWRDPLVGRDILIGSLFGVAFILLRFLAYLVPKWQGRPPGVPIGPDAETFGMAGFPAGFANQIHASVGNSFVLLLLLLLLFIIVRRTWLAALGAYLVLFGMAVLSAGAGSPLSLPFVALLPMPMVASLYRYGLLASVSGLFVVHLWVFFPVTTELSSWYASGFVLDALVCVALVFYGFYTSLAGQPLFRDDLLKD